jgi:hypothetical protein
MAPPQISVVNSPEMCLVYTDSLQALEEHARESIGDAENSDFRRGFWSELLMEAVGFVVCDEAIELCDGNLIVNTD